MPLLFEKFIGFFLWIRSKGLTWTIYSLSCQHQKKQKQYFVFNFAHVYGLSLCGGGRETITDIYHNCFLETFSSFMVVFTMGVRLNLTSKVSIGLFLCVYFDRNKQQPQHSWTSANVLAHVNVFFLFPWHIKSSTLAASSLDFPCVCQTLEG